MGTSECLLEYAQDTATTQAQAQLQYMLSASGQFALPLASSNENQPHAEVDGSGTSIFSADRQ